MTNDPRLKDIQDKLSAIRAEEQAEKKQHSEGVNDKQDMNTGLRAGAELVTSIIAGGLIGYGLDRWLDTKPIFLIAMLILGVITGFVNVWRTTQNIGYKVGYRDQTEHETNNKNNKQD